MGTPEPSSAPLSKSRGMPGSSVRARGMSRALSPFLVMIFVAGWVFGAIVSPELLRGPFSGLALIVLAGGLLITWNRAVKLMGRHEQGAEGEERVARSLEGLPEGWKIFHSVPFGDKTLDHVVVGPQHLYVIETIQWPGTVELKGGNLAHGRKFYGGYTLPFLKKQADRVAVELQVGPECVSSLVCMAGGRFVQPAGVYEGVWLGELQDLLPFLENHQGAGLDAIRRTQLISRLNDLLDAEGGR